MKIIIWLWNPWERYEKTRHNLWFLFLDYLKEKEGLEDFKYESKFRWEISSWTILWKKTFLLKPQTFMNLSWESLQKICQFYKVDKKDFIVIYDDISMDFWKVRFRDKWSAWWHNWVKDIIKYFWGERDRIKVWVWFNEKYETSDFVLSKFSEEELIDLENNIFPKVYELIKEKYE